MFWRVLIGGFSVLMALSILAIAVFQFAAPKKWLINSVLLPENSLYKLEFEKATGFFPFNAKISHLSILNQDSTALYNRLVLANYLMYGLAGLVNGHMEFTF